MEREYDIFEQLPDGTPLWRGHVEGLPAATRKLQELASTTPNECFAIHLPTREVAARLNVPLASGPRMKPLVFQISYDARLASERTRVLRRHGYEVVSVFGNEAAKVVLSIPQRCSFFIVGSGAPEEVRKEMAAWLRKHYPGVRILALNPPETTELAGADYNAKLNGPENWLPFMEGALGR